MDYKNCMSLTSLDYVRFSEGGMHKAKLVKQEIFFSFLSFRATSAVYGGSQARG